MSNAIVTRQEHDRNIAYQLKRQKNRRCMVQTNSLPDDAIPFAYTTIFLLDWRWLRSIARERRRDETFFYLFFFSRSSQAILHQYKRIGRSLFFLIFKPPFFNRCFVYAFALPSYSLKFGFEITRG